MQQVNAHQSQMWIRILFFFIVNELLKIIKYISICFIRENLNFEFEMQRGTYLKHWTVQVAYYAF